MAASRHHFFYLLCPYKIAYQRNRSRCKWIDNYKKEHWNTSYYIGSGKFAFAQMFYSHKEQEPRSDTKEWPHHCPNRIWVIYNCSIMFFLTFNALVYSESRLKYYWTISFYIVRYTLCIGFYIFISHNIEWLLFYATIPHLKGVVKCIIPDIQWITLNISMNFCRISTICILKRKYMKFIMLLNVRICI